MTHLYYPKWQMDRTEATLSWDVSGYYMYLPAVFIYGDLKKCDFKDELLKKYGFTPDFQQAFVHGQSGNYVMKYSMGQALQFLPAFGLAHLWAKNDSRFPPDGFSFPYQLLISIHSLLVAFLGLLLLRAVLNLYFSRLVSELTVISLLLGSNYLNYSGIDDAMTHNSLFTIYCLLIWLTINWYKKPSVRKSLFIGATVGIAALTRPTEAIACMIPMLWGIDIAHLRDSVSLRLSTFSKYKTHLILSACCCLLIGSLQLFYWYYVSGEWFVYSYEDQGFSWLTPHLCDGFFSYKSGWLIYSPFMIFSIWGFYYLWRSQSRLWLVCFSFFALFSYITFAWDIWWYGGSLGQRAMVQCYPILAFSLAAFIENTIRSNRLTRYGTGIVVVLFVYLNLYWTHQAHRGGLLHAGAMTKSYFWAVLGRFEHIEENLKLLDTDEIIVEEVLKEDVLFSNSGTFDSLTHDRQTSEIYSYPLYEKHDWIRVNVDVRIDQKEWDAWKMTQLIVSLKNDDKIVKKRFIRLQRHLTSFSSKSMHIDVRSSSDVDGVEVRFWNAEGDKPIWFSNMQIKSIEIR